MNIEIKAVKNKKARKKRTFLQKYVTFRVKRNQLMTGMNKIYGKNSTFPMIKYLQFGLNSKQF